MRIHRRGEKTTRFLVSSFVLFFSVFFIFHANQLFFSTSAFTAWVMLVEPGVVQVPPTPGVSAHISSIISDGGDVYFGGAYSGTSEVE